MRETNEWIVEFYLDGSIWKSRDPDAVILMWNTGTYLESGLELTYHEEYSQVEWLLIDTDED